MIGENSSPIRRKLPPIILPADQAAASRLPRFRRPAELAGRSELSLGLSRCTAVDKSAEQVIALG
jgi:hypothetical protein